MFLSKNEDNVSAIPNLDRRHVDRITTRKRASLVVSHWELEERVPCIMLDSSPVGFRIGGTARLERGQIVEIVCDDQSVHGLSCKVIWIGKPGSKQQGEAGLQVL